MADFPALALTPTQTVDARKWLSDTHPPSSVRAGFTPEQAQGLPQPELEQAVSQMLSKHRDQFLPPSLLENKNVLLAHGAMELRAAGGNGAKLPEVLKDKPSVLRALGLDLEKSMGTRPTSLVKNAGFKADDLYSDRHSQKAFVERWSPPGTLEKADNLPVHQKVAYVAILAERILDNAPASKKVNEKAFKATINPESALAEASQVKGFRQVQHLLTDDTKWAAFNASQAKVEITEKTLNDPTFSAPLGLEKVNPYKGYSSANITALASAFGHDVNVGWTGSQGHTNAIRSTNQAAHSLTTLFGKDTAAATKFVEAWSESTGRYRSEPATRLHDAGQFRLPQAEFNKAEWGKFLVKNPKAMPYLSAAPAFEKEHGRVATSAKEFIDYSVVKSVGSEFGTDAKVAGYALAAANAGMAKETIRDALAYKGREKKSQDVPNIAIEGKGPAEGFSIRQLDMGDFRALTIGHETSCCQRLGGAGEACAIHSFKEPSSGVFVIEDKEGKLMAQTWAWVDKEKSTVVFDSVESQRSDPKVVNATAELVSALSAELGEKGFKTMLSDTSFGMTMQVADAMGVGDIHFAEPPAMAVKSSYSDVKGLIFDLAPHLKERSARLAEGKQGIPGTTEGGKPKQEAVQGPAFADVLVGAAEAGRTEYVKLLLTGRPEGNTDTIFAKHAEALLNIENPEMRQALATVSSGTDRGAVDMTHRLVAAALDKGDVAFVAELAKNSPEGQPYDTENTNYRPAAMTLETLAALDSALPDLARQISRDPVLLEVAVSEGNYALAYTVMQKVQDDVKWEVLDWNSMATPDSNTKAGHFGAVVSDMRALAEGDDRGSDMAWHVWGAAIASERADIMDAASQRLDYSPALGQANTDKQAELVLSTSADRTSRPPDLGDAALPGKSLPLLVNGGVAPTLIASVAPVEGLTPRSLAYLQDNGADLTTALTARLGNTFDSSMGQRSWTDSQRNTASEAIAIFKQLGVSPSDPKIVQAVLDLKIGQNGVSALLGSGMKMGENAQLNVPEGGDAKVVHDLLRAEPSLEVKGPGANAVLSLIADQSYKTALESTPESRALAVGKIEDKDTALQTVKETAQQSMEGMGGAVDVQAQAQAAISKGTLTPADFAKEPPGRPSKQAETLGQLFARAVGPEATATLYKSAQEASATRKQAGNSHETDKAAVNQAKNGQEPVKATAKRAENGR